jgi:hypothetical protein
MLVLVETMLKSFIRGEFGRYRYLKLLGCLALVALVSLVLGLK